MLKKSLISLILIFAILFSLSAPLVWAGPLYELNLSVVSPLENNMPERTFRVSILPNPLPEGVKVDYYIRNLTSDTEEYQWIGTAIADSKTGMAEITQKIEPGAYGVFCETTIDGQIYKSNLAEFSVNIGTYTTELCSEYSMPYTTFTVKIAPYEPEALKLSWIIYFLRDVVTGNIYKRIGEVMPDIKNGIAQFEMDLPPGNYKVFTQTTVNEQLVTSDIYDCTVSK